MTKQIDITIYFRSDGTTAQALSYEYNPLDGQDIATTATTAAWVICKMEQVSKEHSAGLGVKMNMAPEFQPHLMAAINQVKASSWNVIQHPRKLRKSIKPNKPTKSAGEKLSGENTPGNASCGLD